MSTTVDDFLGELTNGDSNDREIDCLHDAIKEAADMLDSLGLLEDYEDRLEKILESNA